MADLIVLGGAAAVEAAAKAGGHDVTVSVSTGSGDATQEQTDVESFAWLEPKNDGFRNFLGKGSSHVAEHILVDRARLLDLGAAEMTALVGGLRVLGVSNDGYGVFTDRASGNVKWTGTRNDLVFGSNSILRAVCDVYAADDAEAKFVSDFAAAFAKVMDVDRFDLA